MSLQETAIINILEGLSTDTFALDPRLPPFYVEMINQYRNDDMKSSFVRAVSNKHWYLADYFLTKIFNENEDDLSDALDKSMEEAVRINVVTDMRNMDMINFLLGMDDILAKIINDKYGANIGNYTINLDSWITSTISGMIDRGLSISTEYNYLELISYFLNLGADVNLGMRVATRINNIDLIRFFIARGANNWNLGLIAAATTNNIELINFFIGLGANRFGGALRIAIKKNNPLLARYFIQLIGINGQYYGLLRNAMEIGNLDAINLLVGIILQQNQRTQIYFMGPVLQELIKNLSFEVLNKDYSEWFPLLKEGYGTFDAIYLCLLIYLKQNKLRRRDTFILDDFLKYILTELPSLYILIPVSDEMRQLNQFPDEIKYIEELSIKGESTMDVIRQNLPESLDGDKIFPDDITQPIGRYYLSKIIGLNMMDPPNNYLTDQGLIEQAAKEYILLMGLQG